MPALRAGAPAMAIRGCRDGIHQHDDLARIYPHLPAFTCERLDAYLASLRHVVPHGIDGDAREAALRRQSVKSMSPARWRSMAS